MGVRITGVEPGSPADGHGIADGYVLESINGHEIGDVLDYRFYMTEKRLNLKLADKQGAPYAVRVQKQEYQDLGLRFGTYLMDRQRSCKNKCSFCFIDQLPPGLRESLYFKDDDDRLGFLFGNYITLTNLRDRDIGRIISMRISPVNISVHTTNPELRVEMMKNPRAGEVLRYIPRLCDARIRVNAQLVLCPGVNDGPELERSLRDLAGCGENLQSVSCVPVGITKYREGLPSQRLFTKEEAGAVIGTVDAFAEKALRARGSRTFFASDEFYLKAELPLPGNEFYGEYHQLENGVGMLTLLEHEFRRALELEPNPGAVRRHVTVVTGTAAAPLIRKLAGLAMDRLPGLRVDVEAVVNHFFGNTITVAGLVCGRDFISQMSGKALGEEVLFPAAMLRHEGDLFLDDVSLGELSQALKRPVRPVDNDGFRLLEAMLGQEDFSGR